MKVDPIVIETAAPSTDSKSGRDGKGGRGHESGGRGGRGGKGGRGRGGKGEGRGGKGGKGERFVMPTGQAFFTGGSGSSIPSASSGTSYHIGGTSNSDEWPVKCWLGLCRNVFLLVFMFYFAAMSFVTALHLCSR